MPEVKVIKNEDEQQSIPSVWRPVFTEIVKHLVSYDYEIRAGLKGVKPVSEDTAKQINEYIDDYGEKLVNLTEETWDSSICIWLEDRWVVLIDLRTESEGRSDLVLKAQVTESNQGYLIDIDMVAVF